MSTKSLLTKLFVFYLVLFGVSFLIPKTAYAATFNVTDAAAFQSALDSAAANNQDNTINLAAGTYNGEPDGFIYSNTSGHGLTINGNGQSDTFLTSNRADNKEGLAVDTNGALTIQNLTFKDNGDNGLLIEGSPGTNTNSFIMTVRHVSFIDNDQRGVYVGAYNGDQGGSVTVTDSIFDGNDGGGFYLNINNGDNSALPLTFSRNTVTNNGNQGIYAEQHDDGSDMIFERNYSANNSAQWGVGMGAEAFCKCQITATSNVIANNTGNGGTAGVGVVIYFDGAVDGGGSTLLNFINNTVVHNTEADSNAGGLQADMRAGNATYNIYNNILWNNTVAIPSGGEDGADAYLNLSNSPTVNFSNNDAPSLLVNGDTSNYQESNNLAVDPQFKSGSGESAFQHVMSGSQVVGTGTSSAPGLPAGDFTGVVLHNPPDMGAFNFNFLSQASASSTNSSCSDSSSGGIPDLFQIDTTRNSAQLFFTTKSGTGYNINYGLTPEANQYGELFDYQGPQWILNRTISNLSPNNTYYFKIRATNGCNAGEWSKTVSVKTKR